MLELVSAGYYPATTHRVANATGDQARQWRLSMPLFLHPADNVVLHADVTASEFLAERARARGQAGQS
jgi:isopenicillin N synthase-like dioxygenase